MVARPFELGKSGHEKWKFGKVETCLKVPSDFISDFGKLPFPLHLGKFFKHLGKKVPKKH